jgi:asparagine synthase (glutamine-hydrolysing)
VLSFDAAGLRIDRYWSLVPAPGLGRDASALLAEFRARLERAVYERIRDARRGAVFLSGGLDSSAIAAVACRVPVIDVQLIAARGGSTPTADDRCIDLFARAAGRTVASFSPHEVDDLSGTLDAEWERAEEPGDLQRGLLYHLLCRAASRHGCDVALDGVDGDFATSYGVEYLAELLRTGALSRFLQLLRPGRGFNPGFARLLAVHMVPPRAVAGPEPLLSASLQAAHRERNAAGRATLPRSAQQRHHDRLTSPAVPAVLEMLNRIGAGSGIVLEHPYFDANLLEFCLGLPDERKLRGGWPKMILREALDAWVPDEIRWRRDRSSTTMHFVRPYFDRRRERVRSSLSDPAAIDAVRLFVAPDALAARVARPANEWNDAEASRLFEIAAIANWVRLLTETSPAVRSA